MKKDAEISLLYLTGHHAAGKSELSRHLVTQHNFGVVETGAMVRSLYGNRSQEYRDLSLTEFIGAVETKIPGYFSGELTSLVQTTTNGSGEPVIVNGMRSYSYISELSENLKPSVCQVPINLDTMSEQLLSCSIRYA